MRLIDADKFEAFVIRTNGDEEFVNGVQYVLEKIDNAPTVKAIPLERVEQIRNEIERKAHSGQWSDATMYGMLKAVAIIDKAIKEVSE